MSSALDRDFSSDQLSPYAPKRVREAAHAERRGLAPKSPEGIEDGDAQQLIATSHPSDGGLAIDRYRLPRSLEPTLVPEPCPVPPARSGIGVLACFAVAIAIAAIGALFVVGKFPMSWTVSAKESQQDAASFGSRFSEQNTRAVEQPKPPIPQLSLRQPGPRTSGEAFPLGALLSGAAEGASVVIDGLATGSTVTAGQSLRANTWRIPVSDLRSALVQPPQGYTGSMDVVLELRFADDTLLDRKPLRLEWTAAMPPQSNAVTQSPADLKQTFEQFVENYTASTGQKTFSAREREILFKKFQQFLDSQISARSAR
jgi:hypothetical protein